MPSLNLDYKAGTGTAEVTPGHPLYAAIKHSFETGEHLPDLFGPDWVAMSHDEENGVFELERCSS